MATEQPDAPVPFAKLYALTTTTFGQTGTLSPVLDTANTNFQRDAYTFLSATSSVVDMAIVTSL